MPIIRSSADIIANLTSEIGVESAYHRKEEDRLYLTGIEIAMIVATGVLTSFFVGLFEGVKKGVAKHSEKIGEHLVDTLLERLRGIRKQVTEIDAENVKEAVAKVRECQRRLDNIINEPLLEDLVNAESDELRRLEMNEVRLYLKEVGFPEDAVTDRAERLVLQIHIEWREE